MQPPQRAKSPSNWKNHPATDRFKVQKPPSTGKNLPLTHQVTSQSFQSLEESSCKQPAQQCKRGDPSTQWRNHPAQTARAASQTPTQIMPRSASGPCQSGYSPSRAEAIVCSGSRLTGSVFGLNGNFSARIFSYATISSSYCNVRSISS